MFDVVSIGSITLDSFWKTKFDLVNYEETTSRKAILIPFGEKFGIEDVYFSLGGNAANASVTFSRFGFKSSIFTKIGEDVKGVQIKKWLKKFGVNIKNIETSKKYNTAESIILLQNGERSIITYHGALNDFLLKEVKLNKLKARWWYVSLPGNSYKTFGRLLDFAEKNNIKIALNPSGYQLSGDGREYLIKHISKIDLFIVNEKEASSIVDIDFDEEDKVFSELNRMVKGIVAVTKGRNGVVVSDGIHIYKADIFEDSGVIDRTGAGDAFGSGFLVGLMDKRENCKKGLCNVNNIKYAIKTGSANATSVVERLGTIEGILDRNKIREKRWNNLEIRVN